MYRNLLSLIKLFSPIILVVTSCVIDVEEPFEESLFIEQFEVNYNQIDGQLYLQVGIEPGNKIIDEVFVIISADNFDSTIYLNDDGIEGDLVAQNNRFSAITEINLPFQDYQIKAVVQTSSSQEFIQKKNITIEEQFAPEILDVIFWQKNADGTGAVFDPSSEAFQVNNDEYNYLDFQVIINDLNGLEDIRIVHYQINVENMAAEDSCGYEADTGFLSYPQWFLEYVETTDAGFVFDVNNAYLEEPGIPIKPIGLCGRTGVSIFRFIVEDMTSAPVIEDKYIGFDKCNKPINMTRYKYRCKK